MTPEVINLLNVNLLRYELCDIDNQRLMEELKSFDTPYFSKTDAQMRLPNISDRATKGGGTHIMTQSFNGEDSEAHKFVKRVTDIVSAVANKPMMPDTLWFYPLSKMQSIPNHSHKTNLQANPHEYYSIAYYATAPQDCAALIFNLNYCEGMHRRVAIVPRVGDLLVFNSYVEHMTDGNRTDEERFCISADFMPIEPDTKVFSHWVFWTHYLNERNSGKTVITFG